MPGQYRQGFTTQPHEITIESLPVTGTVPAWLTGTLVRNGPGQFEVGKTAFTYRHWFDGLAMLHSFSIQQGQVRYANRYLQSRAYREDNATGKLNYSGFASDPCRSLFSRVMSVFQPPESGNNAVVNVAKLADRYIAMTETPIPVEFDPKTLETLAVLDYDDALSDGQVATAHPHFDYERGTGYNHMLTMGVTHSYRFYRLTDTERQVVASIPVTHPGYMHSFGMSENHLILAEFPLRLYNVMDLALGKRPFIENFEWNPEQETCFHIVHKDTGKRVATVPADPFFAFHHVNAYEDEDGDSLIVDLCAYDDAGLIDELYLRALHRGEGLSRQSQLRRYRVPLSGERATYTVISDEHIELPRINYRHYNAKPYRFVYGNSIKQGTQDFLNQLIKIDVESGQTWLWYEPQTYPGEPVFVPAPDADSEDDGVILSVVLDAAEQSSFLLVLDARDFSERARARVPQHIPFGFHGEFFMDVT